jgi:hypothetical protein
LDIWAIEFRRVRNGWRSIMTTASNPAAARMKSPGTPRLRSGANPPPAVAIGASSSPDSPVPDAGAWTCLLVLLFALWAVWAHPDGAFRLVTSGADAWTPAFADPGDAISGWPFVVDDDIGDPESI